MGVERKVKKVIRASGHRPFGGDEKVDRNGISTENHMEIFARLIQNGPNMHGPQGERKKRTH